MLDSLSVHASMCMLLKKFSHKTNIKKSLLVVIMFDHCSSMDKWSNCLNKLETVRTVSQIIDIIMATVKHHFF